MYDGLATDGSGRESYDSLLAFKALELPDLHARRLLTFEPPRMSAHVMTWAPKPYARQKCSSVRRNPSAFSSSTAAYLPAAGSRLAYSTD